MGYLELLGKGIRNPEAVPDYLRRGFSRRTWRIWETLGFHLVPDHFFYPVPDLRDLKRGPWPRRFPTDGLDMNEEQQLDLAETFSKYASEYSRLHDTGPAPDGDGGTYYSLVRKANPDRIVEVGAGSSTNVALRASSRNDGDCEVTAVEPYPDDYLRGLESDVDNFSIVESKAETLDPSWYCQLEAGDVLFVDSSHVVQVGNDVVHLFLRVLPRLSTGVYVHVHDVKLPYEYSEERILEKHHFWQERYLLHAFLLFNDAFEVVWAAKFMAENHRDHLVEHIPGFDEDSDSGGSFWMRRVA